MKKTFKPQVLAFIKSLGIPLAGIAGDGVTYSKIVCLFPYYTGQKNKGNLSMYAYGKDYHTIVEGYLTKIAAFLKESFPAASTQIHVDKGEGDDQNAAFMAGLGIFGKNGLLINETYGSFVFIGYVQTDLILEPDSPLESRCPGCNRCLDACPGGAIIDGKIDVSRCASAISQKKGALCDTEKEILRKSGLIWGCDICQTECPLNEKALKTPMEAFYRHHIYSLSHLAMTNKEFLALYGDRAFSWRGKAVLNRNLEVLSAHETKNDGHTN